MARFPGLADAHDRDLALWPDLPQRAREYLEWIERESGVPIASVPVGPEREAEVRRAP